MRSAWTKQLQHGACAKHSSAGLPGCTAVAQLNLQVLAAESEQAPPAEAQPSGGDAAEISQQLHALASLLSLGGQFQQASQLIGAINEAVQKRMRALPQSFHKPMLPEGSLSSDQASPEQAASPAQPVWLLCVQPVIMAAGRQANSGIAERADPSSSGCSYLVIVTC